MADRERENISPGSEYSSGGFLFNASNDVKSPRSQELIDQELLRLQKRADITAIMRSHNLLQNTDPVLMRRLSGVMLRGSTVETVIGNWRRTRYKSFKNGADLTSAQTAIFDLGDQEIESLYGQVKAYLDTFEPQTKLEAVRNASASTFNDRYQLSRQAKNGRSLESLQEKGIRITITTDALEELRGIHMNNPEKILIEEIKNKRIIAINGFKGSKGSLTIHDIFDHLWMFDILDNAGVLYRHKHFFDKVGNPHQTDIFKREGELVASPVFEWRAAKNKDRNFTNIISLTGLRSVLLHALSTYPDDDLMQQNTQASVIQTALDILDKIPKDSDEARTLQSVCSGVLVELLEQRRKHGYIKIIEENEHTGVNEVTGVLSLMDSEYMALIIEITHLLFDPELQAEQILINLSCIIEEQLVDIINGKLSVDLIIKLEDLVRYDFKNSELSDAKKNWFRDHLGFAAKKEAI